MTLFFALIVSAGTLFAQSGTCGSTLSWSFNTKTGLLSFSGFGEMSYSGNAPWYNYRTLITKVSIPEEVTSVAASAFSGCSALDTIVWNVKNYSTISSATNGPLYNIRGQIKSITFGQNVQSIPAYLCYGMTKMNTPIVIPESVTSIGTQAFYNCSSVPSLTLNKNIKSYSDQFYGCSSLTKVYYTGTIADWCDITFSNERANPLDYAKNLYINNTLVNELTIPSSVTSIGAYQFCSATCLTKVTLPYTITTIGKYAFVGCSNLESINLENTALTKVNEGTFSGCSKLKAIEFPNSVTTIESAFPDFSSLRKVTFGKNLTSITNGALNRCRALDTIIWNVKNYSAISSYDKGPLYNIRGQIKSITFGQNVQSIPAYLCYEMTGINAPIIIPESVTSIGTQAFYSCTSVPSLTLNKNIKSYSNQFYSCSGLTKVYYAGTIADWCGITFSTATANPIYYAKNLYIDNTLVSELTIPSSVTSIGAYQFYNATCLTKVTLPYTITSIGADAFRGCSNLESINLENTAVTTVGSGFSGCSKLKSIEFPNSVTTINSSALTNCSSLRKVTFGKNLTSLDGVPSSCSGLDTVVWNVKNYSTISSYDKGPLYSIRGRIKTITFGPNVQSIPAYLCYGMTGIVRTIVPASVTSIGTQAFYNCTSNKTVINHSALDIVKGATTHGYVAYYASDVYAENDTIGDFVFGKSDDKDYLVAYLGHDCQITLPTNYRGNSYAIGDNLFRNNTTANSITISNAVTSIGEYAFSGCSNLNVVYIGNSVLSIGTGAFYDCPQLYKVIMLPNTVPSGINSAFQTLSGRITYVGNTNYASGYNVLGTQRVYSNLNSYFSVDGIVYALVNPSERTCDIIDCDYSGATTEFSVGNTVVYKKVTLSIESINQNAFRNNSKITKMVFDGNHSLPSNMASGCSSIDTLIITSNVGYIGSNAFSNSSKKSNAYYFINNSGDIYSSAFAACDKLDKLIITDAVKNIGTQAFYRCDGIVDADIYNNGRIGSYAFQYSSTSGNATYHLHNRGSIANYAFANCTAIKTLVVDSCVGSIGQYAFQKCTGLEDVTLNNNGMIGVKAFESSSTKNIATYNISNVGLIRESAFANCTKLRKVRLGNQVGNIYQRAFYNCIVLDSLTLPNSVEALGDSVFFNCKKLAFAQLSNTLLSIGNDAFNRCNSLPEIFIPKSVFSIGQGVFRKCSSLSTVGFEDGTNPLSLGRDSVNRGLFYDCPLDSVYIGRELTYQKTQAYGYSPFYRSPTLRSIVISDVPSKVETNEFYGCTNLYYVSIGNGARSIGYYAFSGCSSIDYFSFGSQVQTIGKEAFSDCVAMTRLYTYCQQPPTCGASALADIDKWSCTLYIPEGTLSAYTAADQWKDFFFIEENNEKFTITWKNDDGSIIDQTEVSYGKMPTHTAPVKPATEQYSYTFAGWTPEVVAATGNATYTATYTSALRMYTVTFLDEDGSPLSSQEWNYGATPTCDEPIKPATAQYTYTFVGWTPEVIAVTGNATYTATYTSALRKYTVTFLDENGSTLSSQQWNYGATPTCDEPIKPATAQYTYTFAGWNKDVVAVTGNATYTATYTSALRKYTVTFLDEDGSTLSSQQWNYGATPTCDEPTKPATAQYTYTFAGWTPEVVAVTGNATYTATYTSALRKYTVTFLDEDGSTLSSQQWNYGAIPTCDAPTKPATAQYTYTFAGWNKEVVAVTGNATYTATYTSALRRYTVTFLDEDGFPLSSQRWNYGATPTCDEPTKPATAQYTYTFVGWDQTIVPVTGNATYTATYTSALRKYMVTFLDENGSTLSSQQWNYGTTPTCDAPTKPATAQYTYTFAGWNKEVVAVTGNATYTATYTSELRKYTVTFLDEDGSTLSSQQWNYGATPTCGEPIKPATAQYTYTFAGWNKEVVAVTGNATYTATYTSALRKYTVTFLDENNNILCEEEWEVGSIPSCVEPTKPADGEHTYIFAGWTPEVVAVTGDATYTATFSAESIHTNIPEIQVESQVKKVVHKGKVFIIDGDNTYTIIGQKVK